METFYINPENKAEQEKGKMETVIFNENNIGKTVEKIKKFGKKLGAGNYGTVLTLPDSSNYCVKINRVNSGDENDPIEELDFMEVGKDIGVKIPTPRALVIDGEGKNRDIYTFMDTVDGLSLQDIMESDSLEKIPANFDFFDFFEKLEADLKKLNEVIYHRDIKPENILLDHDGGHWIIDFGQSKWVKDLRLNENATFEGDIKNFRNTKIIFANFLKGKGMDLKKTKQHS
ncbi:MAG TPA: serine/threonine-protein kinase [Candidatus Methylomirabilis sp.]|nr:serine/threonine-protein kinase [Candidatus Methylomirabilis sp.]